MKPNAGGQIHSDETSKAGVFKNEGNWQFPRFCFGFLDCVLFWFSLIYSPTLISAALTEGGSWRPYWISLTVICHCGPPLNLPNIDYIISPSAFYLFYFLTGDKKEVKEKNNEVTR